MRSSSRSRAPRGAAAAAKPSSAKRAAASPALASPAAKRAKPATPPASPPARTSPRSGDKGVAHAKDVTDAPPALPPADPAALTPAAAAAASTLVRARLLWPTGAPAATLALRPAAAAVAAELARVVGDAVTLPHGATSALLVGPRGAGKTLVVERVLRDVRARVGCTCALPVGATLPAGAPPPRVGVVRLSGLLHWEERVAFREAARQLCAQFGLPFERSASHDENIGFFGDVLARLAAARRAAIFVLDDVDAFARRPRQALLYNLCDRVSGARVAAALVGVSARVDAVDLLEKRVRSRFSGRVAWLPRPGGAAPGDGDAAAADAADAGGWPPHPDSGAGVLLESLTLPPAAVALAGAADGANGATDATPLAPAAAAAWNDAVAGALGAPGARAALEEADFFGLLSCGDAAVAAVRVAGVAALEGRAPTEADVTAALAELRSRQRDLVAAVRSASVLEVFVLAALARVAAAGGRPSFDAAWGLYAALSAGGYGPDADRGRGAAWAAFQRLVGAGLVTPAEGRGGAAPPASAAAAAALRPHSRVEVRPSADEVAAGARRHPRGLGQLAHWLERGGAVGTRGGSALDI